jgi:hypothetical protein
MDEIRHYLALLNIYVVTKLKTVISFVTACITAYDHQAWISQSG